MLVAPERENWVAESKVASNINIMWCYQVSLCSNIDPDWN
jgi:hypothetical protein